MWKHIAWVVGVMWGLSIGMSEGLAAEQALTVLTEDWPPYNYQENGEVKGFAVEIVQAIMKELHVNYPMQVVPDARKEKMLAEDPLVMSFSLFRTPERENLYKWIGPISSEAIYFYKKKGNPLVINTLDDAKKVKRVACLHKGAVFSALEKEGFTNLDVTPNTDGVIKKVAFDRADLSCSTSPLGVVYWLKQANLPVDTLEQTPVKLFEFPLYIACTKDVPDAVIQEWQAALDKIKASALYSELYDKYLGK